MDNFSVSMEIFGKKIQEYLLSSPLRYIILLSISLDLIGCRGSKNG